MDINLDCRVWFVPSQAGCGSFQVYISVEKMQKVLMLNVAAECYQVRPLLTYHDLSKVSHEMAPDTVNHIHLGVVSHSKLVCFSFLK